MTFAGNVVEKTLTLDRSAVKITNFVLSANQFTGVMEVLSRKFNLTGSFGSQDKKVISDGKFNNMSALVLIGSGTAVLWDSF